MVVIRTIDQDVPEILDVEWSVGGAADRVKETALRGFDVE
jgi:hypothetical protein